MNNKKNSVLKPIISVGFDKSGKIQSFVNTDRVNQIKNVKPNIDALIAEVTYLNSFVLKYRIVPVVVKSKLADLKKSVPLVKAAAKKSNVVKSPLNKTQLIQVNNLIYANQLLAAVKLVKEYTAWGLKECKEYVDSLILLKKSK